MDAAADPVSAALAFRCATAPARGQSVFPLNSVGVFLLLIAWVAVPHRGWMRTAWARWLVFCACAAAEALVLMGRYTSPDEAVGYLQGLVAVWAVVNAFRHVVATDPQREAARVVRVDQRWRPEKGEEDKADKAETTTALLSTGDGQLRRRAIPASTAHAAKEPEFCWETFPSEAPLGYRLWWAYDLVFNIRGTGVFWLCYLESVVVR